MGQYLGLAVREYQRQLMGKSFAVVKDSCVSILFLPVVDKLHRTPEGNMPPIVFSEHSVEQSSSAEQPNVAAVERS